MKLQDWMKREGLDDESVALSMREMDGGVECSPHTVAKWRRRERTPRGRRMQLLKRLTKNEVTANDFFDDAPESPSERRVA